MKILAADDDEFTLELLTMMSERLGFSDFTTALSGEMALKLLYNGNVQFDCLLIDVKMPDMDGIELCSIVRTIPAYRNTPIIMLTTVKERSFIDRAFKAGATDYANKSFDVVELGSHLHMAEEVIVAQRAAKSARATSNGPRLGFGHQHPFELCDMVPIEGVDGLIAYSALGNYMTQLSHSGLGGSQIMAVKVKNIEVIDACASSEERLCVLTNVADAIGDVFRTNGYMMAYAGNGAFVIVTRKVNRAQTNDLQDELQKRLDVKTPVSDQLSPIDIEISLGNPIRPSTSRPERILKIFDRAIKRVESQVEKGNDHSSQLG